MRESFSLTASPAPMCSAPSHHRAQLQHVERPPVAADAPLAVDRGAARLQPDRRHRRRQQRRAQRAAASAETTMSTARRITARTREREPVSASPPPPPRRRSSRGAASPTARRQRGGGEHVVAGDQQRARRARTPPAPAASEQRELQRERDDVQRVPAPASPPRARCSRPARARAGTGVSVAQQAVGEDHQRVAAAVAARREHPAAQDDRPGVAHHAPLARELALDRGHHLLARHAPPARTPRASRA